MDALKKNKYLILYRCTCSKVSLVEVQQHCIKLWSRNPYSFRQLLQILTASLVATRIAKAGPKCHSIKSSTNHTFHAEKPRIHLFMLVKAGDQSESTYLVICKTSKHKEITFLSP